MVWFTQKKYVNAPRDFRGYLASHIERDKLE
jgi:hypothetical protein